MWIVSPYNAAATFGIFSLSEGIGLSSQLGDTGSYFLSLGIMMIAAVYTQKSIWFYAPSIMLSITAVYRILSWLLHDAHEHYTEYLILPEQQIFCNHLA